MIFTNSDMGSFIGAWRKCRGLTQAQAAEMVGVNQPIISAAETGSAMEAQQRMARVFYCQLGSFEAEEMQEITDCVKLAKSLGEARKWLRITREVVGDRICMGVGSVAAAESPHYVGGIIQYLTYVIEDVGRMSEEDRARVVHASLLPSYWVIPQDVAIPKGAYRPERLPVKGSKAAAEMWRMQRDADFDGRGEDE